MITNSSKVSNLSQLKFETSNTTKVKTSSPGPWKRTTKVAIVIIGALTAATATTGCFIYTHGFQETAALIRNSFHVPYIFKDITHYVRIIMVKASKVTLPAAFLATISSPQVVAGAIIITTIAIGIFCWSRSRKASKLKASKAKEAELAAAKIIAAKAEEEKKAKVPEPVQTPLTPPTKIEKEKTEETNVPTPLATTCEHEQVKEIEASLISSADQSLPSFFNQSDVSPNIQVSRNVITPKESVEHPSHRSFVVSPKVLSVQRPIRNLANAPFLTPQMSHKNSAILHSAHPFPGYRALYHAIFNMEIEEVVILSAEDLKLVEGFIDGFRSFLVQEDKPTREKQLTGLRKLWNHGAIRPLREQILLKLLATKELGAFNFYIRFPLDKEDDEKLFNYKKEFEHFNSESLPELKKKHLENLRQSWVSSEFDGLREEFLMRLKETEIDEFCYRVLFSSNPEEFCAYYIDFDCEICRKVAKQHPDIILNCVLWYNFAIENSEHREEDLHYYKNDLANFFCNLIKDKTLTFNDLYSIYIKHITPIDNKDTSQIMFDLSLANEQADDTSSENTSDEEKLKEQFLKFKRQVKEAKKNKVNLNCQIQGNVRNFTTIVESIIADETVNEQMKLWVEEHHQATQYKFHNADVFQSYLSKINFLRRNSGIAKVDFENRIDIAETIVDRYPNPEKYGIILKDLGLSLKN